MNERICACVRKQVDSMHKCHTVLQCGTARAVVLHRWSTDPYSHKSLVFALDHSQLIRHTENRLFMLWAYQLRAFVESARLKTAAGPPHRVDTIWMCCCLLDKEVFLWVTPSTVLVLRCCIVWLSDAYQLQKKTSRYYSCKQSPSAAPFAVQC